MRGDIVANAGDSAKQRALDFYPTPPDVTEALMRFLDLPPSVIWECACGDGAKGKHDSMICVFRGKS